MMRYGTGEVSVVPRPPRSREVVATQIAPLVLHSRAMLKPAAHLVVNAGMQICPETPVGQVVAYLGKMLADTKDIVDRAYGVGLRVPLATEVPWRLEVRADADGKPIEVIMFAVRLDLADGGVAFRAEMDRRAKVAEMLARVAAAPMGPA